jgi:hypothetical protein
MDPNAALILGDAAIPSKLSLVANLVIRTTTPGNKLTIINDQITGNGGLTVQGNAVVRLTNSNNTFLGATTITGTGTPKLYVDGAKNGDGDVIVDSTGILGGVGSVVGAVTNRGSLAPGDANTTPATLTLAGNLTNAANSHWAIDLSGTAADKLAVGGNIDLSAFDSLDVSRIGTGFSWVIATYAGTLTGTFNNVTSGYFVDYGTGSNSQITLIAAVPEPATFTLVALGLIALQTKRRRHSQHHRLAWPR